MSIRRAGFMALVVTMLCTPSAFAHPGHGSGFSDGLQHAFTGLDHLLAMVAVGLLAVRSGGRGIWILPAAFLLSMLAGGLSAAAGFQLPGAELGVLGSVLAFGALLFVPRAASLPWSAGLVALFAFFHGYVHIQEMAASEMLASYAAGMLLSTGLLHACGIAAGLLLVRVWRADAVRFVGAAVATCGLLLFAGWL